MNAGQNAQKGGASGMKITVATALHKPYRTPQDAMYLPVQVGAGEPLGCQRDDQGENISALNPTFCELTAQYWLWKNRDADALGLCHYRRYFTQRRFGRRDARILTQGQAEALLRDADVLVPRPRWYLIETNGSHYAHAHGPQGLELARQVIAQQHPDCLPAFDRVMKRRHGRRFNMCIMKKAQFAAYSAWLFSILMEMEARSRATLHPERDSRLFGFVAERLMDVWLEHTQPRIRQLRVLHLESQHWPGKIAGFLRRKFRG